MPGQGAGQQGFARAGWAVQHDAARHVDAVRRQRPGVVQVAHDLCQKCFSFALAGHIGQGVVRDVADEAARAGVVAQAARGFEGHTLDLRGAGVAGSGALNF